ncbi:MAG: QueT transporter family protein [Clostridia bacterium]
MKFNSKSIARSALVAALYVALTLPLGALATTPFIQIRPAEALTMLPILMPSSIVGLVIGCGIVNLVSSTIVDAIIGTTITLIAGILTKLIKNPFLAGLPPVLLNAIGLPIMFYILGYDIVFMYMVVSMLISQTLWVYGLGLPLHFTLKKLSTHNEWLLK